MNQETIAAIATPPGEGAISIIRVSGAQALEIVQKIFNKSFDGRSSHTAVHGKIVDALGETLDSVLVLILRAPKSYTGENSVEIFCHGGSFVTRKVLARVIEAGARPAKPGEFSLRAFLNGKLDLAQAEAVQELIAAKSELAMRFAKDQLEGLLSEKIRFFQKGLTEIAAILEAWIDFPEEGLEFTSMEEMTEQLSSLLQEMEKLLATFHHGKMVNSGISLCLAGSPNVGKSSLMNALLRQERAIVTDIAGTTRDLLSEDLFLSHFHFRITDTAGIRSTQEIVEKEGIRRSRQTMEEADLILLLLDAAKPLSEEDRALLATADQKKTILVWNKTDVQKPTEEIVWPISVEISAKEKRGLDLLEKAIESLLWKKGPPSKEEIVLTKERHYTALCNAVRFSALVLEGLSLRTSPELITSDLRSALHELSSMIGGEVSEDILSAIFSKFCLGK